MSVNMRKSQYVSIFAKYTNSDLLHCAPRDTALDIRVSYSQNTYARAWLSIIIMQPTPESKIRITCLNMWKLMSVC